MNNNVTDIILRCANDGQCPLPDLVSEIAQDIGVTKAEAIHIFRKNFDYILANENLLLERSEVFWEDVEVIDKFKFLSILEDQDLSKKESPFYYISFAPTA